MMRFKFRDVVIYKDEFATYTGAVVSHRYKRNWYTLWLVRESWYEVNVFDINGEDAMGIVFLPEKVLKYPEGMEKKKKSDNIIPLNPKK
jgi:hypothetical protein